MKRDRLRKARPPGYAADVENPLDVTAEDDLCLAHGLADTADAITVRYFKSHDLRTAFKDDGSPVTAADRLVESVLREKLRQLRPLDVIVGEEMGTDGYEGRCWFLDPLDGTKGYIRGKPDWRTLIAVVADGAIQLGVASSPGIDQRWWAIRGGGAWSQALHGAACGTASAAPTRLAVSTTRRLDQAVLALWPPPARWPVRLREATSRLETQCRPAPDPGPGVTRHGALLVALGRTDAFLMAGAGPWDLAAMAAIVEGAGGRFSDIAGGQSLHTGVGVFSNGVLHEQMLGELQPAS